MHVKFEAQYGETYFLALDKGIRPKEFVEIINVPGEPGILESDPEWLGIAKISAEQQFAQVYPD